MGDINDNKTIDNTNKTIDNNTVLDGVNSITEADEETEDTYKTFSDILESILIDNSMTQDKIMVAEDHIDELKEEINVISEVIDKKYNELITIINEQNKLIADQNKQITELKHSMFNMRNFILSGVKKELDKYGYSFNIN